MYTIYPKIRIKDPQVGEMSQQFRVLTALTKEIGSPGSKAHSLCNVSYRRFNAFFPRSLWAPVHICTHLPRNESKNVKGF